MGYYSELAIDDTYRKDHTRGSYLVDGWDNDLKQLKHYRWVRNQISHEPNCTGENMCESGDTAWLNNFYARIMNQTDPLTLYAKATKPRPVQKPTQTYKQETYTHSRPVINNKKSSKHIGRIVFGICILAVIAAIVWITKTI